MSAEQQAYEAAERRIAAAREAGEDGVDLAYKDCAALTRLPDSPTACSTFQIWQLWCWETAAPTPPSRTFPRWPDCPALSVFNSIAFPPQTSPPSQGSPP